MHTYIMVRGVQKEVEKFKNDLSAQWVKFDLHGQSQLLQVGVRPIELLEIVYPKDCQEDVMKMLMPFDRYKSEKLGKGLYFLLLPICKALGIMKNKVKSRGKYHNYKVFSPFIDKLILGHKYDRLDPDGTEKI